MMPGEDAHRADLKVTRPKDSKIDGIIGGAKPIPCLKKWKWAECQQEGIF